MEHKRLSGASGDDKAGEEEACAAGITITTGVCSLVQKAIPFFQILFILNSKCRQTRYKNASRMKSEGMLAGIPDLFLAVPTDLKGGLFIELKAGKGKTSEAQELIMEQLRTNLYTVEVCRSLNEFMKAVNNYLDLS